MERQGGRSNSRWAPSLILIGEGRRDRDDRRPARDGVWIFHGRRGAGDVAKSYGAVPTECREFGRSSGGRGERREQRE